MVPEVLFSPQDIGLEEGGIGQLVHQIAHHKVSSSFEPLMYENIVVGGGNALIPGFKERLQNEIQHGGLNHSMTRKVRIIEAESYHPRSEEAVPLSVWKGLKRFSSLESQNLENYSVTRAQYEEEGNRILK